MRPHAKRKYYPLLKSVPLSLYLCVITQKQRNNPIQSRLRSSLHSQMSSINETTDKSLLEHTTSSIRS